MNNYRFNSIVSNSEQAALKEMIFKRANERAIEMADDIQASFTSNIQNDVMDIARESFSANRNPFSQIIKNTNEETKVHASIEKPVEVSSEDNIGFSKRVINNELKERIASNNEVSNKNVADEVLKSTMIYNNTDLTHKSSFMGALNFLNSQASIALIKNKGQKFEALA